MNLFPMETVSKNMRWIAGTIALCAPVLFAQTAPARVEFEVASIKPAASLSGVPAVNIGIHIDGAQFSCTSYSLKDYIRFAYRVKAYQVIGPEWLAQERFEVTAKIPGGAAREQVPQMMQALMEECFKLKLHHEQKGSFRSTRWWSRRGGPKMKKVEDCRPP